MQQRMKSTVEQPPTVRVRQCRAYLTELIVSLDSVIWYWHLKKCRGTLDFLSIREKLNSN